MIFLFPTEMEAARFRLACADAKVVICGVGMAAVSATMAELTGRLTASEMVILAGIAGSYDTSDVAIAEVVEVSSEQIEELPAKFGERYENSPKFSLRAVSSNTVSRSNFVGAQSQIENMEGAPFFAICGRLNTPCAQIRAISNKVGDGFEKWSVELALERLTTTLIDIYNR